MKKKKEKEERKRKMKNKHYFRIRSGFFLWHFMEGNSNLKKNIIIFIIIEESTTTSKSFHSPKDLFWVEEREKEGVKKERKKKGKERRFI